MACRRGGPCVRPRATGTVAPTTGFAVFELFLFEFESLVTSPLRSADRIRKAVPMNTLFKDLLKKDGPVIGLVLRIPDPAIIEYTKAAGFDFVRIDNEHGMFDNKDIRDIARVAAYLDMPCHIRVSDLNDITKFLDCGITGVVVPGVDSVERAKEAVSAVKVYPLGSRGQSPVGRGVLSSEGGTLEEYNKTANDAVMLTVQIESVHALPVVDDIIGLPGVDMVAVGRADISQSMGKPGQINDPEVVEMENLVVRKTLEYGKTPAIGIRNPETLRKLADMGVKVFVCGPDETVIRDAMKNYYLSLTSNK